MEFNLERLLDSVSKLYSLDTDKFIEVWYNRPKCIDDVNIKDEDLSEYLSEVKCWFEVEFAKKRRERQLTRSTFTLRNPDDLIEFEEFLDRMLRLYENSPGHFIKVFPQCPIIYWDKIDDLRETSYKRQRDSEEYLNCLEKCKALSFVYSELMDLTTKIEEDEFDYGEEY